MQPPIVRPSVGAQVLQVTVTLGGRPLGTRVSGGGADLLPDVPLSVSARRQGGGWVVEGPDGPVRVRPGEAASVRHGALEARFGVVRPAWLPRFAWGQGDVFLPVLMLATTLLTLQVALFWSLLAGSDGGPAGAPEPSPEYLARLLEEQFNGKDIGVVALRTERPTNGDPIDSFYLQPGQDGPRTHIGGGKDVGEKVRDGEVREKTPEPVEEEVPVEEVVVADGAEPLPDAAPVPEPVPEEDAELHPAAQEAVEGWGVADWYDTEDAREDAAEIRQQLKLAHDLLRLDPDDPYGLSIRAYYEYLATDYAAAQRTYDRFTTLFPDESAGWNNLALVHKRQGDYEKEEALYRLALEMTPDEDHALNNLAVCLAHQGRYDEALAIMKRLETLTPDDPYADLHRAKIYAAMGKDERAYHFLQRSLSGMRKLDTLHNIEFRQDIRLDPALDEIRKQKRFHDLLVRYYGDKPGGWWKRLGTPK